MAFGVPGRSLVRLGGLAALLLLSVSCGSGSADEGRGGPGGLVQVGYVVIQPNYRGSSGYGESFQNENGFRNWQTSIGDIVDSADYLVSQGIADKNRLAIVGWSYGGYAALQSAAIEPTTWLAIGATSSP